MNTTEREIQQLNNLLQEKLHHPFLMQHIENPVIDEHKVFFLNYLINKPSLAPETKENMIVSVMLVQIALDIHEKIPNEDYAGIGVSNQLAILAGDYYSGLYYQILAELGEHQLISVLATAIKHVNEIKMELYLSANQSVEGNLEKRKQINSLLIKYVAEYVNNTALIPVMEEFLFMTYLMNNPINGLEDIKSIQEYQIKKTKGMIDGLPNEYTSFKQDVLQLFETTLYQHTAWEKD